MSNPKFSIVLIARNEVKVLSRLVKSLEPFLKRGGEIVLLDTGSSDGTPELAKELGCKVTLAGNEFRKVIGRDFARNINKRFITPGEAPAVKENDTYFDFASARNKAASLATNDIVCFADADEVFSALDIDVINKIIDDGFEQFEYNFVFAHDEFGREKIKFVQSKMYDRRKVKWTGIVHELLTGEAKRVFIEEKFYKLEHWQNQESGRHIYLTGLLVDCFLNPAKDRNSHYCARELFWSGRPESAIKEFRRHIEMNAWLQEKSESMIFIGDCYGALNKVELQASWYSKAFFTDNSRRKPLLRLAQFNLHHKNYFGAIAYAKAAMEIPYGEFYANDMAEYTNLPEEILYQAYGWVGNIEKAKEHILNALKYQPGNQNYLRDTKYYFSYPENYIEGWMGIDELNFLYDSSKLRKNILEVGSWRGRSTNAILQGATETEGHVTAVDTWQGSQDKRDMTNWMVKEADIFGEFQKNTAKYNNLTIHRGKSVESAPSFKDKSFDMIFIDAGHTKHEVMDDINAWLPKVKEDGLICGHDYVNSWMGVVDAVDGIFGKPDGVVGTIWWVDLGKRKEKSIYPTLEVPAEAPKRDAITAPYEGIPKKIWTAWFSEEPMPQKIKQYIESQKIAGYDHIVIDLKMIQSHFTKNTYVQQCLNSPFPKKKWVKLTDYIRMWVLYNEGGIFLDADVEVIQGRSFDSILNNEMFVGNELGGGNYVLGTALIGAKRKHPLIKEWMETVETNFRGDDDLCYASSMDLLNKIGVKYQDKLTILPREYFYCIDTKEPLHSIVPADYTIAYHYGMKTWVDSTIEPGQVEVGNEPPLADIESHEELQQPKGFGISNAPMMTIESTGAIAMELLDPYDKGQILDIPSDNSEGFYDKLQDAVNHAVDKNI